MWGELNNLLEVLRRSQFLGNFFLVFISRIRLENITSTFLQNASPIVNKDLAKLVAATSKAPVAINSKLINYQIWKK